MTDDGLRGVAYHEAGHAVVALALDLRVARVEIFHENNSGETDSENADHLPIEHRIAICVAGIQANKMFKVPIHGRAAFLDRYSVRELISDMAKTAGDVLCDKGHQRARDLLKAHAHSVHDIAERLLTYRKIDLTGYVLPVTAR
jgi:ATP-dependent Zn protease